MKRLLVHVEGPTEESFVKEILAPHLYVFGYEYIGARIVGNARQRGQRGGIRGWDSVRKDIVRHLKRDQGSLATTMVDYYGLPQSDNQRGWPGSSAARDLQFERKLNCVQEAILADVSSESGLERVDERFYPFVVMHEFEGLLFSDCDKFGNGIVRPDLSVQFQKIRDAFSTPEEINDSQQTAPSKRILDLFPEYQKPLYGVLAALEIGLDAIRRECPHFNAWLEKLETWCK